MGTMTKSRTPETAEPDEGARRYLRNTTGGPLVVHPSARPTPDLIEPDALVEVDAWALPSLVESGFTHVGKAAAAVELDELRRAAESPDPTTGDQPGEPNQEA